MRTRHSHDDILDAARQVVVERGVRGTTLEAIASQSDAPVGSIYYRFESVDELLARLWLRAATRSQEVVLEQETDDPVETVVAGALALFDHCLREPEDAMLLASFRPTDLNSGSFDVELRRELETVNAPTESRLAELTREIFGSTGRASIGLVLLAFADLPYRFARSVERAGKRSRPQLRRRLEACVRAVLADP